MPVQLTREQVELVEGGVSMKVATRDAALRPELLRVVGAVVGPDRSRLTLFVPSELAHRTVANLENNGAVAVTFSQITNHRTLQVKGKLIALRRARRNERAVGERWLTAFGEQLAMTGFSRRLGRRVRYWPSIALELEITELYAQTPGPGAGRRLEGAT
jgi:hypothetical protein